MTDWISERAGFDGLPSAGSAYDERIALLDAARQLHAEISRLVLPPDGTRRGRAAART